MYEIFTRNWWRMENGKKVPDAGARRTHIKCVDTSEEARDFCIEGNENRPEYWEKLSRKYEWTQS